jgi:hypothetical protein
MAQMRTLYSILGGKPERKRPFGRFRCTCEDNIRMDLTEMEAKKWTEITRLRALVNTVMNLRVP